MKMLVTGASGFIGKNIIATLQTMQRGNLPTPEALAPIEILPFDLDTPEEKLDEYASLADFVLHLAGINRPKDESEFMAGNFGFTSALLDALKNHNNKAPILITSSIQATLENPYGKSKKAGEDLLRAFGEDNGVQTLIYRLPNVFGKWSRPNYNSAVATFCHNIARDLPITVNDASYELNLVYVDDVVGEMINAMCCRGTVDEYGNPTVYPVHKVRLGQIVELLESFRDSRTDLSLPDTSDAFARKLHATYLSFLPTDCFSYDLRSNVDNRGSFTEVFKTPDRGQFSVNIQHAGITKGEHWHHTKNEKFLVVAGTGVIRFRPINGTDIIAYHVDGSKLEVVDIPPGYTHNIENLGNTDLVTLMWANENFDPNRPDTYFLKVENQDA